MIVLCLAIQMFSLMYIGVHSYVDDELVWCEDWACKLGLGSI